MGMTTHSPTFNNMANDWNLSKLLSYHKDAKICPIIKRINESSLGDLLVKDINDINLYDIIKHAKQRGNVEGFMDALMFEFINNLEPFKEPSINDGEIDWDEDIDDSNVIPILHMLCKFTPDEPITSVLMRESSITQFHRYVHIFKFLAHHGPKDGNVKIKFDPENDQYCTKEELKEYLLLMEITGIDLV